MANLYVLAPLQKRPSSFPFRERLKVTSIARKLDFHSASQFLAKHRGCTAEVFLRNFNTQQTKTMGGELTKVSYQDRPNGGLDLVLVLASGAIERIKRISAETVDDSPDVLYFTSRDGFEGLIHCIEARGQHAVAM